MKIYTILDFESTGLNKPVGTDQITQVAAIKFDETGRELARFSTYVRLTRDKIPSKYTPQITIGLCNTGMKQGDVLDTLFNFIGDTTLVCQYAPFDFSFLDWHPHKFICTRALSYLVDGPNVSPSLKPTCERHGIKLDNHHDAVADVMATKEVLFLMLKKAEEKEIPHIYNTVIDFKDRPLTYYPAHALIIQE
ncbi:hypothetical protein [Microcystis phage MaeS]|nr:hypothetical protein [Microcystis phage MaeS]